MPLAEALEERNGLPGVAVDPMLLARLDAKLGETVMIGVSRFTLRAILRSEPDKLAGGIGFGPRVMMTRAALSGAELAKPGSIVRYVVRVTLRGGADAPRRSPPTLRTPSASRWVSTWTPSASVLAQSRRL
jgi:putative ABC transport system permease protein